MLSTYGPMTFCNERGGLADYDRYPSWTQWLSAFDDAGFTILDRDAIILRQSFPNRLSLLRNIAQSGTGAWSRQYKSAKQQYDYRGENMLTYQAFLFIARKKSG